MKREKDSGEGIEGNWDYHPIYPIWPSAPPPQQMNNWTTIALKDTQDE